jgi:SAD/SRA domain
MIAYILLLSTTDNDQGEKVILAVVVDAPETNIRKVVIWSDDKEEKITLYLRRGDAYCMDGKMQLNYTHGVAAAYEDKDKDNELSTDDSWDRRICIVFRQGKKVMYKNDSGTPCIHLNPSAFGFDTNPWYGQVRGLKEGCLYSRREIYRMGAHTSQQQEVSGNSMLGCDAIVVAGLGEVKGDDTLFELVYSASTRGGGAEGMILSRKCGYMVRVYRTNKYDHKYRAIVPRSYYCGGKKKSSSAIYRYDGLYEIEKVPGDDIIDDDESCCDKKKEKAKPKEEVVFRLKRCGVEHNRIVGDDYMLLCNELGTLEK